MEEQKLTVRAVERALDILLAFTESPELGLTEIAGKVSLHKSTVHRLLASLEGKGFIKRNPDSEKYRLGYRIWELAANLHHADDPAVLLLPEMERLRDELGETITLYVREGNERIRIQAVQSKQAIRRVAQVGARLPLYVGASSKVLLAFAEQESIEAIMNSPDWPESIDKRKYLQQLAEIRQHGLATSVEEREVGAAAASAPIFNRQKKLFAALSVSGPSNRWTLEKMRGCAQIIIDAANRMGNLIR
ncbi:MAG TPA: IclR family transcriptional regulator [Bacilli bacterium]